MFDDKNFKISFCQMISTPGSIYASSNDNVIEIFGRHLFSWAKMKLSISQFWISVVEKLFMVKPVCQIIIGMLYKYSNGKLFLKVRKLNIKNPTVGKKKTIFILRYILK